ncbi:MAG: DUF192 domain-containing protein [Selenomonadaceae bacterium]|nr:DUF192 domain-containing protein [Selenomonadaceae bacterium]
MVEFRVEETGATLNVELADNAWKRMLGLMGRRRLDSGTGLFIVPCNSIHMMFMRFSIDAVYVDKEYRIKKIVRGLRPWFGLSMCWGAFGVLELPAGDADKFDLNVGQTFDVNPK